MKKRNVNYPLLAVSVLVLLLALVPAWQLLQPQQTPQLPDRSQASDSAQYEQTDPVPTQPPQEPEEDVSAPPEEVDGLPVGKLVITPERRAYRDKQLTLFIPAIDITRAIYSGTDSATLNKGVGLYDYAQLPGQGNRNVSMAGHRNGLRNGKITDRAPFYYIDTLEEGDYIYLYDTEHIYRYLWEYCEIVQADDWSPIYTTGSSCLTITSCHPIGVSDHRIVVRAALDEIIDYDKDYNFPASVGEEG